MLAQNFKSAADLGITEPQLSALQKTLVLLETGKLKHVPTGYDGDGHGYPDLKFSGQFNMNQWAGANECGSICCIGGTAQLIGNLAPNEMEMAGAENDRLARLFYPDVSGDDWSGITDSQAATALRSYLTTGDARWDLAVSS
jgi:hypothetical protein